MAQPTNDKELHIKLDATVEHIDFVMGALDLQGKLPKDFEIGTKEYYLAVVYENIRDCYFYTRTWYNDNI